MLVNILFCHFYDGHRILRNCLLFSQKAKNTLIYSVREVGIRNATSTRSTKIRQLFPSGCQKCILNKKTVSNALNHITAHFPKCCGILVRNQTAQLVNICTQSCFLGSSKIRKHLFICLFKFDDLLLIFA